MSDVDDDMTPDELVTILDEENRRAVGYLSDEVRQDQDENLDRYLGRPYGDEDDGSSNAVSMDVAEVVDWATQEGQQTLQAHAQAQSQDPKATEAQGKLQIEGMKAQMRQQLDAQSAQHKAQMAEIEATTRKQIAELQANMDYQIAQMRIVAETQAQKDRTQAEMDLAYWKADKEHALARETSRMNGGGSGNVRFGGQVG